VLTFSYVGYSSQDITVGSSDTIDASLQPDNSLDEVVVTAQGIKKEKKALGYAVSTLKGNAVSERPETDVARALSGQVAGVNILGGSGIAGSGTNITIRGFSSITGDNQPLIIVDGVPFSNSTNETSTFSTSESGNNSASRLLDLDPNNISEVSVLKGLSATTLYGEQGRNGVILITTKNGSGETQKKFEVSVNSSYFVEKISSTPDYQNRYGGGWQNSLGKAFSNWGAEFTTPYSQTTHVYSGNAYASAQNAGVTFDDTFPDFAGNTSYVYKPYNSVEDFFEAGYTKLNNVNISKSSENLNFNLAYTNTDQKGFTPNNTLKRNNFSMGGTAKLSNRFTFNGSMMYTNTNKVSPPNAASTGASNVSVGGTGIFANVLYTPRSINLMGLPYKDGQNRSVYYRGGNDIQNPRWTAENEIDQEITDRVFISMSGTYELNDWMSLTWRTGLDSYNETASFKVNKGGINLANGLYYETRATEKTWDHSFITNIDKDLSEKINLSATAGFNSRRNTYTSSSVQYDRQLIYGLFFANNFENRNATSLYQQQQNVYGLYGSATFGYDDYLYLNVSGRNDWASTHETGNNSLFYPGASISFIPTSAFPSLKSNTLNYLKLRFGYGSSARFAGPYVTRSALGVQARGWLDSDGNPVNVNGSNVNISGVNRLGNPDLTPELVSELEFGLEFKLLNNNLGFETSIYKKDAKDQILDQRLDPSTGYTVTAINAGNLQTKGIEVGINAVPYQNDDFRWDFILNFDAYESTVTELPVDGALFLSGPFSNLGNFAIEGQPFNTMMGQVIQRDGNGNPIVGTDGLYLLQDEIGVIGDPNPDWNSTFINNISYKGFKLSMQWDYTHGGDMYSATANTLLIRGLAGETAFDRSIPVVAPGVFANGTPNNIQISPNDHYWENLGNSEFKVYDATSIRLREISLSYSFPEEVLSKTPFGDLTISAIGNNLWFKAVNFPDSINFDPSVNSEGVGNSRGFDLLTGPTAKRYGISLRASF
jgi:TonB-linked SusC/RagA family outer membrane protein